MHAPESIEIGDGQTFLIILPPERRVYAAASYPLLFLPMNRRLAARSWSAPVPWRFRSPRTLNSARGLAHSKTLPRFLVPMHAKNRKEAAHEPPHRSAEFHSAVPQTSSPPKPGPLPSVHGLPAKAASVKAGPNACANRKEAAHEPKDFPGS